MAVPVIIIFEVDEQLSAIHVVDHQYRDQDQFGL
jgi:hypothetical protein